MIRHLSAFVLFGCWGYLNYNLICTSLPNMLYPILVTSLFSLFTDVGKDLTFLIWFSDYQHMICDMLQFQKSLFTEIGSPFAT